MLDQFTVYRIHAAIKTARRGGWVQISEEWAGGNTEITWEEAWKQARAMFNELIEMFPCYLDSEVAISWSRY